MMGVSAVVDLSFPQEATIKDMTAKGFLVVYEVLGIVRSCLDASSPITMPTNLSRELILDRKAIEKPTTGKTGGKWELKYLAVKDMLHDAESNSE